MVKIGSIWGQNDVIGQNLGKVVKNIFSQNLEEKKWLRFLLMTLIKIVVKRVKNVIFKSFFTFVMYSFHQKSPVAWRTTLNLFSGRPIPSSEIGREEDIKALLSV